MGVYGGGGRRRPAPIGAHRGGPNLAEHTDPRSRVEANARFNIILFTPCSYTAASHCLSLLLESPSPHDILRTVLGGHA